MLTRYSVLIRRSTNVNVHLSNTYTIMFKTVVSVQHIHRVYRTRRNDSHCIKRQYHLSNSFNSLIFTSVIMILLG